MEQINGENMRSYRMDRAAQAAGIPIPAWGGITKPCVINVESMNNGHYIGRSEAFQSDAVALDVPAQVKVSKNPVENSDSFHTAIRPIILLAQCFAILPLSGMNSPDPSDIKFKWRSFKLLYCAVAFLGSATLAVCSSIRLAVTGITSTKTTSLVFFGSTCITNLLLLRLAVRWSGFILAWENTERNILPRNKYASKTTLATKFKIMTVVIFLLALVEHTLSIFSGYRSVSICFVLHGHNDTIATYFETQFPQVFSLTSYSHWKGVLIQCINILSTFSWNFMDLFLILISIALVERFRQLNRRLYSIKEKAMSDGWWAEARKEYNSLAVLTRRVDDNVSDIVLLSFATNLYFICIQLLNSLNVYYKGLFGRPMYDAVKTVYFCFSFGFLLARTAAVSLYAAAIQDESILPAPVLYSVSEASYSTEVSRFLTQVTTDKVSLTGMRFFSITRGLVLTVAGTIVTYEVVLVQFNAVQQSDQPTINFTNACPVN